jgi:hypothetical protein
MKILVVRNERGMENGRKMEQKSAQHSLLRKEPYRGGSQ